MYGIEPRRVARVLLAHTTVEEMAASSIAGIRHGQPRGPYLLAGLCAGEVIAYEMACQLVSRRGKSGAFARSCTAWWSDERKL